MKKSQKITKNHEKSRKKGSKCPLPKTGVWGGGVPPFLQNSARDPMGGV